MDFEWDEDNRKAHLVKHGVDFRDALQMFDGPRSKPSTSAPTTVKPASTRSARSRNGSTSSPTLGAAQTAASSAREKPMPASRERITRVPSAEARRLKGETDWARIDAMTDDDIAKAVADDPDAPPLDIDWTKASLVIPPGKDAVTLRLDRDVLDWFRAQGKGYQTRINQVLRVWYEAAEERAARKAAAKKRLVAVKKAAAKRAAPVKRRA